ncbi:RUS1 family protein [archaeon]|nr:MAG: RUS1 family protein [archaeon]
MKDKLGIVCLFCLIFLSKAYVTKCISSSSFVKRQEKAFSSVSGDFFLEELHDHSDKVIGRINLRTNTIHSNGKERTGSIGSALLFFKMSTFGSVGKFVRQTFLPLGYPKTVPAEYTAYQAWNVIQDLCSYLRGIMATNAVLAGMGVGRADITSIQATILWVLRDGASLIGGLLFTSLSSYNFVQNIKFWRLFADSINNVGITLDMLTPYFPLHFLPLVCVGSTCKALCGVAAGATNAAISMHWGEKYGNVADILAKNNAQHTVVSLCGLAVSLPFAQMAGTISPARLWTIYSILTVVHMVSNYMAMRVLALRTLNRVRFHMILDTFLSSPSVQAIIISTCSGDKAGTEQLLSEGVDRDGLFTTQRISAREPIVSLLWGSTAHVNSLGSRCRLYLSPTDALKYTNKTVADLAEAVSHCANDGYCVLYDAKTGKTAVCMEQEATIEHQVKAHLEAALLISIGDVHRARSVANVLAPELWDILKRNDWAVETSVQLKPPNARVYRQRRVS